MVSVPSVKAPAVGAYKVAWFIALVFYFFEYVVRSSPAVMIPELSSAFRVDAVGVSAIIGSYYYTYSVTSLVAGAALDRFGARASIPFGAALLGLGCLVFVIPVPIVGDLGRLLQGAGSAFAFTGAVFLAAHGFSGSVLATAIGVTQCIGMLGGSAGQFAVGPLIHGPMDWKVYWIATGAACVAIAIALFASTPGEEHVEARPTSILAPFKIVFTNPQSYLCGAIAGLLFVPTTVGDMIWGVAFFQQDRGFDYGNAVSVASMVPLGWAIGCPVLGWLADFLGRRKPALILGAGIMLAAIVAVAFTGGVAATHLEMLVLGIGSGAAMIPYTSIKEVNPDSVKGSAVGVINFLTFGVTAAIGPVFANLLGKGLASNADHLQHFRQGAWFWAGAVALAIVLSFFLRETGRNAAVGHSVAR
ncbi:MFS transporter [Beijerinckia sp. L45]|uniref:MFS transporter n=1 Tax=Beijerinckia sp. L45 TaxID=1641855 RepID=UPI00131D8F49|nr:MFS transporter [Beijerinckia sp. L45]